jgi:hypothetical protein
MVMTIHAMKHIGHHDNWSTDEIVAPPSERSFGITFAVVFALLAVWLYWRKGLPLAALACLTGSLGFLITALLHPSLLKSLNRYWLKLGLLLHRFVNPIIMGLLFFAVFVPIGLIMRAWGKDFMRLRRKGDDESYWVMRKDIVQTIHSMRNQF